MRLRYRTTGPDSIWYENINISLPSNVESAKQVIVDQCKDYFGAQFDRYDNIVISIMRGSNSVVDIVTSSDKQQVESDNNPLAA